MNSNIYFPLVVASGRSFCNRENERKYLAENIHAKRHTLLLAPRRYGKTSLLTKVLEETKVPSKSIDLFTVTNAASLFSLVFNAIGELSGELLPKQKNMMHKLYQWFHSLKPTFEVSLAGQKIKFQVDTKTAEPKDIAEALMGLDKLAEEFQKTVVFVFDEFQQITTLEDSLAIEGAIRHAMERSKHVCYVFSGSTRHILRSLFDDQERPLYRSCDKIILDRIKYDDYQSFLNVMAVRRWKKKLVSEVVDAIITTTQRHPYYVSVLCERLWREEVPPTLKQVQITWKMIADIEKTNIVQTMTNLSVNQRAVLMGFAKAPTKTPTSHAYLTQVGVAAASVNLALKELLKKDYVYVDSEGVFRVLDPLLAYCINPTI